MSGILLNTVEGPGARTRLEDTTGYKSASKVMQTSKSPPDQEQNAGHAPPSGMLEFTEVL